MKQNTYKTFRRYIRRTYKNKLCAISLFIIGLVPMYIINDATVMVLMLIFGVPLFFAKRNYILD